ncbi:MAG: peptidoglycan bridge formation glycyltransferase FemA/FemB family protein [Lyngbya sp. HA4199-MV5]|jgi:lipid II:glycine glycyltransferase (peptidoglycan interpeptide bridge formation enzyme)|nr:peptidoglycan bridge formation glycyltransferase FemA/FemB family protein [Lyngbya sp. HA4199-MV5]
MLTKPLEPVKLHETLEIRLLTLNDCAQWDAFLQASPTGCFMQAWVWGEFKQLEGYQSFRYGLFAEHLLVGVCCFYYYPCEHTANLLVAPGAPCFLPGFEQAGMSLLLEQARALAKNVGAIALRLEPLWLEKPICLNEFVRAPVELLPSETLLIDLRPPIAKMLASMKPKGRYNIRLSQRHGVTTHFTTDSQAIPVFYNLFWETVQRQQFFGEPYSFFINFCQTLFAANMAEIGWATWQNEVLATVLMVYWGDRATYLYGGRSEAYPHVMASYGLHWAAMQRAKAKGCSFYDFYGYTRDPSHNYAKFSQFKRQFGGTPVTTIGAHDYFFYDQLADTLIGLFKRLGNERER